MTTTATSQELGWALAIKQAAAADPSIHDAVTTDWEYLQHAIVAKGRIDKALVRLRNQQAFKERYGIKGDGSVEEAARDLAAFYQLHPGFFLSVTRQEQQRQESNPESERDKKSSDSVLHTHNSNSDAEDDKAEDHDAWRASRSVVNVVCVDASKALKHRMKSEEAFAVSLRALFYMLQCINCNCEGIRSGYCQLVETNGVGWRNFSLEADRRGVQILSGAAYPTRLRQVVLFNPSPLVRWFYRIVLFFVKPEIRKRVLFTGDQHDFLLGNSNNANDGDAYHYSLDVFPTSWGGVQPEETVIESVLARLRERYRNSEQFRLPP